MDLKYISDAALGYVDKPLQKWNTLFEYQFRY